MIMIKKLVKSNFLFIKIALRKIFPKNNEKLLSPIIFIIDFKNKIDKLLMI